MNLYKAKAAWCGVAVVAAILAIWPATASAEGPATKPARIELKKTQWQALPADVQTVVVGPDERAWYVMKDAPGAEPLSPADLKRGIEREFGQRAPQIAGASPVAFEPEGRVWFTPSNRKDPKLYAYDGTNWIEHDSPKGEYGWPGWIFNAPPVAIVAKHVFVPGLRGVDVFDGKDWHFQRMHPAKGSGAPDDYNEYVNSWLRPTPDGQGVVMVEAVEGGSVWQWRDGKWSRTTFAWGGQAAGWGRIVRLAMLDGRMGVWRPAVGGIGFSPIEKTEPKPVTIPRQIIQKLDGGQAPAIESAVQELAAMGPGVITALEHELEQARTGQRIRGLELALDGVRQKAPWTSFGSLTRIDGYGFASPRGYVMLPDGGVAVLASKITHGDEKIDDGVLVVDGQGKAIALAAPKFATQSQPRLGYWYGEVGRYVQPQRGWIGAPQGMAAVPGGPALVDVATGETIDQIPDGRYGTVLASTKDGRVYVSQSAVYGAAVMVYTSGAPRSADLITAAMIPNSDAQNSVVVGSDGTLWAECRAPVAVRKFNGSKWEDVVSQTAADRGAWPEIKSIGQQKSVLVATGPKYTLVGDGEALVAGSLRELIEKNKERFAQGFKGRVAQGCPQIVTDGAGNVWVRDGYQLTVLSDGKWHDAAMAIRAMGMTAAATLDALGTAKRVLVANTNYNQATGNREASVALAEVRDGEVVFSRVEGLPESGQPNDHHMAAPEGGVWVGWTTRQEGRFVESAYRITDKGVADSVLGKGLPQLVDGAGRLWLPARQTVYGGYGAVATLRAWKAGEVKVTLEEASAELVMDKHGSLWAWTPDALLHLVDGPGDAPGIVVKRYLVVGLEGRAGFLGFTKDRMVAGDPATFGTKRYLIDTTDK